MKLSEAIRLGSMLHPQAFGAFHKDGKSCAIGAAEDAGFSVTKYLLTVVLAPKVTCPDCVMCVYGKDSLYGMIVHLNDDHRWTREAIADWVETVEINAVKIKDAVETEEEVVTCCV